MSILDAQFVLPDYRGRSLVNLMASIKAARSGEQGFYDVLNDLPLATLRDAQNVVLLMIDGLGYDYLCSQGKGSEIHAALRGNMHAVAPPTTASAVSTFLTGDAPQQHGVTGWFTWMRELGSVVTVLPFQLRAGRCSLDASPLTPRQLFGHRPIFDLLEDECYSLMPDWLSESAFNRDHLGKAQLILHKGIDDYFAKVVETVQSSSARKYIYAYWPSFDAIAHDSGVASKKTAEHFARLDEGFAKLQQALSGTNTLLLLTSDHGFIDTTAESRLLINDHPALLDCLQLPLCGEPRMAYAYVRDNRHQCFVDYVQAHLAFAVDLHKGEELIALGMYGLGVPHPELHARVGDYVMVMKDQYILTQTLPGERGMSMIGQHGGLSAAEVEVPLVMTVC